MIWKEGMKSLTRYAGVPNKPLADLSPDLANVIIPDKIDASEVSNYITTVGKF